MMVSKTKIKNIAIFGAGYVGKHKYKFRIKKG